MEGKTRLDAASDELLDGKRPAGGCRTDEPADGMNGANRSN